MSMCKKFGKTPQYHISIKYVPRFSNYVQAGRRAEGHI
jgi:hypothetical protein